MFEGLEADGTFGSVLSWRDLAHNETPVVALDGPLPGIVRCVVAPVPLLWLPVADRPARHPSRRVRCLAVDDRGNLAAPEAVFTGDAEALLAGLRHHLAKAQDDPAPAPNWSARLDTVAALRDPVNWRLWAAGGPDQPLTVAWQWATRAQRACEPHGERVAPGRTLQFVGRLGARLQQCVDWVVGGLPRSIGRALRLRPDLRHGLARLLLQRAERHGDAAVRYTEQALLCEPLPNLRWFAEDEGIAQALFTGASLPRALCRAAGISAAAARHVARQADCIPELAPSVWLDVLAALDRLPSHRRPFGSWQWARLAALVGDVAKEGDARDPDMRPVVISAMLAGARRLPLGRCAEQPAENDWQSLVAGAASAEQLAIFICRLNRETSGGRSLAGLRHLQAAGDAGFGGAGAASLAERLIDALGEGNAERFGELWLELLPAVGPMRSGGYTLRLLRTLREVLRLGRALRNCVRRPDMALSYLVSLRCLIAVEDDGGRPIGLVALLIERSGGDLLLQVSEALGPRNGPLPVGAASAAEEFADRMSGQSARFESFVRFGEALGRLGRRQRNRAARVAAG